MLLSVIMAQTSPGTDLFSYVPQAGIAAVFIWLFWDERKERRAAQLTLERLFERLLPIVQEATSTLEVVQGSMARQVQKAESATPSPSEMAVTIRRLEELTLDLQSKLRKGT